MRYYWYITKDPKTARIDAYRLSNYIKRSLTLPESGVYYIVESINGYIHNIADNKGFRSTVNDEGDVETITDLHNTISSKLISQWRLDNKTAVKEIAKRIELENDIGQSIVNQEVSEENESWLDQVARKKRKSKKKIIKRKMPIRKIKTTRR